MFSDCTYSVRAANSSTRTACNKVDPSGSGRGYFFCPEMAWRNCDFAKRYRDRASLTLSAQCSSAAHCAAVSPRLGTSHNVNVAFRPDLRRPTSPSLIVFAQTQGIGQPPEGGYFYGFRFCQTRNAQDSTSRLPPNARRRLFQMIAKIKENFSQTFPLLLYGPS